MPDYPAHLDVEYPDHLSRGLVLVKWWLLAIPHYIVVGILLGGGAYAANEVAALGVSDVIWGGGLIGLLVLIAAVVLLFTGRYPQSIFDLVLGLNRWVLRVAAYAGLMTDRYPPFRLDQGGAEPSGGQLLLASSAPTSPAPVRGPRQRTEIPLTPGGPEHRWGAGRVVLVITGCVGLLLSLSVAAAGSICLGVDVASRDPAGFVMNGDDHFATDTYALTSESFTIHSDAPTAMVPETLVGDAKVQVTAVAGSTVFVGVAPTEDVDAYLRGVRHAKVVDLRASDTGDVEPVYDVTGRHAPATPPADLDIWTAQSTGSGTVSLVWPPDEGEWTLVVMNADGSSDVAADVAVGASLPWLCWMSGVLLVGAAIGLLLSLAALYVGGQPPGSAEAL